MAVSVQIMAVIWSAASMVNLRRGCCAKFCLSDDVSFWSPRPAIRLTCLGGAALNYVLVVQLEAEALPP